MHTQTSVKCYFPPPNYGILKMDSGGQGETQDPCADAHLQQQSIVVKSSGWDGPDRELMQDLVHFASWDKDGGKKHHVGSVAPS